MPELCRFLGIIIKMQFDDHDPPHVRVWYGGRHRAKVGILDGEVLWGNLPSPQLACVIAWLIMHQMELAAAWHKASQNKNPGKIPPLR